ncbi:MAG: tRNA pseudouridine(55) synthase TruB [Planctomycetales bacterium]|nr:tRNA pseudouridine(55) synthase TruB [Planctomycetales bacterium]
MFGLLNIDKPLGLTSRDVVNRVQRLVRPDKAGHAGTLDPLADGVLVVCIGQATRLIEYVQQMPKRYEATFRLGQWSESCDLECEPVTVADAPRPTDAEIEAVLPEFTGLIQQRPPAHSAIRVQGKRAFDLARQGHEVELAARPVMIYELRVVAYKYPELKLDIRCGSGTYVRSLGRDLAERLGTAAVMSQLTRTEIGVFRLDDAAELDALVDLPSIERALLPARNAISALPHVMLDAAEIERIRRGQFLDLTAERMRPPAVDSRSESATLEPARLETAPRELAALDEQHELVAILAPHRSGQWKPHRNLA